MSKIDSLVAAVRRRAVVQLRAQILMVEGNTPQIRAQYLAPSRSVGEPENQNLTGKADISLISDGIHRDRRPLSTSASMKPHQCCCTPD